MTQYEYEYFAGQKAYSEGKPFSSSMSVAWQQGWIDARESFLDSRFGPDPFIETKVSHE